MILQVIFCYLNYESSFFVHVSKNKEATMVQIIFCRMLAPLWKKNRATIKF
ncbi:hypothetical protein NC99_11590 [Sunxiuqinia dokdonensis]|uniref:Uncharacterized protein n=1 Tax=Sunxiuqinia dokdonensis TaxID=1409788 RepID=A0A0L8VC51_9BACT|nr:hypothetical protein NC99_11590 [Sunxiuqinia dokdonensis]